MFILLKVFGWGHGEKLKYMPIRKLEKKVRTEGVQNIWRADVNRWNV